MDGNRERRRLSGLQAGMLIILLIAAAIGLLLLLFQIRTAAVIGNERYSSDRIVSDLIYDFPTQNSLYLGWKYRSAGPEERTPYLSSVQVKITAPGDVQIIVQEKSLSGYVEYNGSKVYYDSEGTVLEISDEEREGIIRTNGMAMEEPQLYKKLPVENTAQLRTVLSVIKLLSQSGLDVSEVSFDENQNITAQVGTIEVLLGQDEYMEEKVSNLAAIYQLQQGKEGVLNMSAYTGKNEPITFSTPDEETEAPETDAQAGDGGETAGDTGDAAADEISGDAAGDGQETPAEEPQAADDTQVTGVAGFMVFDSSGTLRYDARVINGQVVDAYGNPIDGCSVNEDGNVVDAYWNVIDPMTGTLAQ